MPAWDLAAASYDSVSSPQLTVDSFLSDLAFNSDGTKLYIAGSNNKRIYQYSLSTAWDVSTATYDSVSKNVGAEEANPFGLFFKPDGTRVFVVGDTNRVYQYDLGTSWVVSSAAYNSVNVNVTTQDTNPHGVVIKSDGTKLFVLGNANRRVYQYTLGTAGGWCVGSVCF